MNNKASVAQTNNADTPHPMPTKIADFTASKLDVDSVFPNKNSVLSMVGTQCEVISRRVTCIDSRPTVVDLKCARHRFTCAFTLKVTAVADPDNGTVGTSSRTKRPCTLRLHARRPRGAVRT